MPRTYSAKLLALTLGMPVKWVDNVLSHVALPGVAGGRQGLERRIGDDGVLALEIVRLLNEDLRIPIAKGAEVARIAIDQRSTDTMHVRLPSGVSLSFPLREMQDRLRARTLDAVESIGRVPRGRPRTATK